VELCFNWTTGLHDVAFRNSGNASFIAGFLIGLPFDPEDGGSMFLRKVGWLSTDDMMVQGAAIAQPV
jgi:hypothetical protein